MNNKFLMLIALAALGMNLSLFAEGSPGAYTKPAALGSPLTVEAAIEAAVTNQPTLLEAEAGLSAARSRVGEAQAAFYPTVSGSGSYTRVEPNQSFTFPGLGTFALSQEDNWDFHLGASQVLYAFGRRDYQLKLAESGVRSAAIGIDQVKSELAFQTARSFYSVLFLQEELKSLDGQLEDLGQHLAIIQKKAQTGSATKFDILSTQVRVASLRSERIQAANQYERAKIVLANLVGLDPAQPLAVSGGFTPSEPAGEAGSLISKALAGRSEVRQAAAAVEGAELSLSLAAASGLPTLMAQAEAGYKNGLLPDATSLTFNWNASLVLDVPLFSGFAGEKRIEEARARLEAARKASEATRRSVTTEVLQAFQEVASSREAEQNSRVQLDQAQQALDAAKVQYDIGVITNVEYLDAQTALEQAKLANLLALYDEVTSDYALRQAIAQQIWR